MQRKRGLRHDRVVLAARERQRAACIIGDEREARVEEGIALAQVSRRAICGDDFRLELDHIDPAHRGGHGVTTTPPP